MGWRKLGLVYQPQGTHAKLLSHAANPLPIFLHDDIYRVFFSGRDAENRSSVGAVDIDVVQRKVVREYRDPWFTHGPEGSFYEAGVSIGNDYEAEGKRFIGFMGWQNQQGSHWRGDIGRLQLRGDGMLALDSATTMMGADATDPISLSYPFVMHDGQQYRMWYGSTVTWDAGNSEMLHVIKRAHSQDGLHWHRDGLAVPYTLGEAQAFSRPSVVRDEQGYHMWFSYRSGSGVPYRIGYAHSVDGLEWQRAEAGIDVSSQGWDSDMLCYPFVFNHAGTRYMLYNGNGYGRTGFGIAQWE